MTPVRAVRRRPGLPARLPGLLGRGGVLRARRWPATCGSSRRSARPVRARSRTSRRGSAASSSTRSSRRRCSRTRAPALMHSGIFWGFVLLTIGTANIVTGGLIQAVLSIPFDGAAVDAHQRRCRTSSRSSCSASIGWAFYRRLVTKPTRLTFNRDALLILAMIGGVVATELLAQVFEVARYGDIPGAFVANALAVPLRRAVAATVLEARLRAPLVGPHRARRGVPVLPAVQQAPPHRHELPEHLVPQARAARRAARRWTSRPRTRRSASGRSRTSAGRTCSTASPAPSAAAARRPARPGTPASRSTPRHFIMGIRDMSVEAEHGIDLIPNSPIVRETYGLDDTTPDADGAGARRSSTTRSRTTRSGTA